MKKWITICSLLLVTSPVWAAWTLLQETHDGILYIDRDGAEKTATGWQIDSSQDFHRQQIHEGKEFLSQKSRHELDCGAKKVRTLSVERFPENMAGGSSVHQDNKAGDWSPPQKGSYLEAIWLRMCR